MSTALSSIPGTTVPAGKYRVVSPLRRGDVYSSGVYRGLLEVDVLEVESSRHVDGDGEVLVIVPGDESRCGYVAASCLAPLFEARTSTVTLAEEVTEIRHAEVEVEVRYFRDGVDVTDRVVDEPVAEDEEAPVSRITASTRTAEFASASASVSSYSSRALYVEKSVMGRGAAWLGIGRTRLGTDAAIHLSAPDALALAATLTALAKEATK